MKASVIRNNDRRLAELKKQTTLALWNIFQIPTSDEDVMDNAELVPLSLIEPMEPTTIPEILFCEENAGRSAT